MPVFIRDYFIVNDKMQAEVGRKSKDFTLVKIIIFFLMVKNIFFTQLK